MSLLWRKLKVLLFVYLCVVLLGPSLLATQSFVNQTDKKIERQPDGHEEIDIGNGQIDRQKDRQSHIETDREKYKQKKNDAKKNVDPSYSL